MRKIVLGLTASAFVVLWTLPVLRADDGADVPSEITVDSVQEMRRETLDQLIHEKIFHCRAEKGKQVCALGDRWQYFSNLFVGLLMDKESTNEEIVWGMRNLGMLTSLDACAGVVFAEQIADLGDWWEDSRPVYKPAVGFLIEIANDPNASPNGELYPSYAPAAKAIERLSLLRRKYPNHKKATEDIDKVMLTIAQQTSSLEMFSIASKAVVDIYGSAAANQVVIFREVNEFPSFNAPFDYVPPKVYSESGHMIACPGQSLSSK